MKKYKCHKIVEAGEIERINKGTELHCLNIVFLYSGERLLLSRNEFDRIFSAMEAKGACGGYLVRYEDGYLSWSPKAVFEAGYTALE